MPWSFSGVSETGSERNDCFRDPLLGLLLLPLLCLGRLVPALPTLALAVVLLLVGLLPSPCLLRFCTFFTFTVILGDRPVQTVGFQVVGRAAWWQAVGRAVGCLCWHVAEVGGCNCASVWLCPCLCLSGKGEVIQESTKSIQMQTFVVASAVGELTAAIAVAS